MKITGMIFCESYGNDNEVVMDIQNSCCSKIYRVAVDMKFHIHIHIHIHRYSVDIHGLDIHIHGYPWISISTGISAI